MKYKLKHKTLYTYVNEVHNYQSILCLQPRNSAKQICKNFKLEIEPKPSKIYSRTDYFGNIQHYFSLHESHKSLKVTVTSEVEVLSNPVQLFNTITCEEAKIRFQNDHALKIEVLQYLLPSQFISWDEEIVAFAETCIMPSKTLFEAVLDLINKIYTEFQFKSGSTNVNTPLKTVLKERKGVCQDFSHLAIASLRSVGIPAKYVSGY